MIDRLEQRRLLATIEGNVFNDLDTDRLLDFFEDGQEGVTVFIDANGNRVLDTGEVSTVTNANGNYRFSDLEPGTYAITHEFYLDRDDGNGGTETVQLAQTSPGPSGDNNTSSSFNIDIVFDDNGLGEFERTLVEIGINRWSTVIFDDLPDANVAGFGPVDDLVIFVNTTAIGDGPGGVLASAGPRSFRPGTVGDGDGAGLPTSGVINVDRSDIRSTQGFIETLTHEVGHILGIGTIWDPFVNGLTYNGDIGVFERNRTRPDLNSSGIELENTGGPGSFGGHWRDSLYGEEIMSSFASELGGVIGGDFIESLSRMTVGAMEDMGYGVNYAGVDPYGPPTQPRNTWIGALPEDFTADLGFDPFTILVELPDANSVYDTANFGVRENTRPSNFYFSVGPNIVEPGQDLRLLAEIDTNTNPRFTGDVDFRDFVTQVNFYRETNGLPGLQSGGVDGDELLTEDAIGDDGYDFTVDTTGYSTGTETFYARAYDRGFATQDQTMTVEFVTGQTVPNKPADLRVLPTSTNRYLVEFIDNSTDESGFALQVSSSPDFEVPEDIRTIYLAPQDGTGVYSYNYDLPTDLVSPNTTRYFRVRGFNTAGSTPFAGRVTARTLGPDELLFDNSSENVDNDGLTEVIDRDGNSTNLTYLRGEGTVTVDLGLTETKSYSVFARNPNVALGSTLVEVIDSMGTVLGSSTITDVSRNADVLVGTFDLDAGSTVRFSNTSGSVATVDVLRLLPAGDEES